MKVKKKKSSKTSIYIVITGVLLLSFYAIISSSALSSGVARKSDDNLNIPTVLSGLKINYETLLSSNKYKIYNDANVSLFLVNKSGIPKIIYAYKNQPQERQLTDNFFVHIYVKDSTKLKSNAKFANSDFYHGYKKIKTRSSTYYVFQKDLVSNDYIESSIQIKDVKYINTGRFKPGVDRSLDLKKLTPKEIPQIELTAGLDKLDLFIKKKGFEKIKAKREEALNIGVLSTTNDDLINGKISFNNSNQKSMEFRLKGDWPDHLKNEKKWSYRVIMKGSSTLKGMRKFSIQHPRVRNYLWEWLYNKVIKDHGIIGLRYDFVDVNLHVKEKSDERIIPLGIMALEESFDKILIENNKKREGIILAFDESLFWADTKKEQHFKLDHNTYSKELRDLKNAPIRVFNENKVLSDPSLNKQFQTAKDLLEGLRQEKFKISEVFDLDKLTTYVATSYLFGGNHAMVWHNLRIYYNPITGKLEPISYDSNSGLKLDKMRPYPLSQSDSIFDKALVEKLKTISSPSYIEGIITKYSKDLNRNKLALFTEFQESFDESILAYNSNYIKKQINPAKQITASLLSYDNNSVSLGIKNLSQYPVTINNLMHEDGQKLSKNSSPKIIDPFAYTIYNFPLDNSFVNAFVSKKNKKGTFQFPKDVQKLRITHHIEGVNIKQQTGIAPYGKNPALETSIASYRNFRTPNFKETEFITQTSDSTISFKKGRFVLTRTLKIPDGYIVSILPGFELDLINNSSIISNSNIQARGTKENPIVFESSDGSGGGIFVTNTSKKSFLDHCYFSNLSNPKNLLWSLSGAVNFHESDVAISNSIFKNNRCEDGLNIIRSSFSIVDSHFEATQSDAFDGDFVSGTMERCTFIDSGNDGIDVSGSQIELTDITITNPSDKAISAGENSIITGGNITINGGEIGIVSKDLSQVQLTDINILGTRLGLSAFQKKSEYGVASIAVSNLRLQDFELNYLIENKSSLSIDNVPVETVSNNVIDQMYGKEYGKSSK